MINRPPRDQVAVARGADVVVGKGVQRRRLAGSSYELHLEIMRREELYDRAEIPPARFAIR